MKQNLRRVLSKTLSPEELAHVCNSYDIIGDIAITRLTDVSKKHSKTVAEAIISTHKNVRTVLAQTGAVSGDFQIRKLKFLSGENRTVTICKESSCQFLLDIEKCFFSPRLSFERFRIAKQVRDGEIAVNMFAGVGSFSIIIARYSNAKKVYSIDVNPVAVRYMLKNVRLNRTYGKVIPILGDAKEIIKKRLQQVANRVLMPLPEKALEYLPCALSALKETGGWIHYYHFEHARKESPTKKVERKVAEKLESLGVTFDVTFGRVVRTTGQNWRQIVLDIKVD